MWHKISYSLVSSQVGEQWCALLGAKTCAKVPSWFAEHTKLSPWLAKT